MGIELFRVTHSKIQCFLRCRKQYWFSYISGQEWPEEDEGPAIVVGNAVHRGMQELTESGSVQAARQRVLDYLSMPKHESAGPGTSHHEDALEAFERGVEAHQSIISDRTWGEYETWAPVPSLGVIFLARVDRMDRLPGGAIQLIDWKTGRYEDAHTTDEQLELAQVAARVALDLPRDANVTAIGWNLRTGTRRERPLTRAGAVATAHRVAGLARKMQAEEQFEPTPGRHCGWCRWRDRCGDAERIEEGFYYDEDLVLDDVFANEDASPIEP